MKDPFYRIRSLIPVLALSFLLVGCRGPRKNRMADHSDTHVSDSTHGIIAILLPESYGVSKAEESRSKESDFDAALRKKLGLDLESTSYIADSFSLDMFSADELLKPGNVPCYYLYDGYGRRFDCPCDSPKVSAYIQDKFELEEIYFNNNRVDRFDAKAGATLQDPFLLFVPYEEENTSAKAKRVERKPARGFGRLQVQGLAVVLLAHWMRAYLLPGLTFLHSVPRWVCNKRL